MRPYRLTFFICFIFSLQLGGCQTHSGSPGHIQSMTEMYVFQVFPWLKQTEGVQKKGLQIYVSDDSPEKAVFINCTFAIAKEPYSQYRFKVYFEPTGRRHLVLGYYESHVINESAKESGLTCRIDLPSKPKAVMERVVKVFNRLLEFEDFALSPRTVRPWAEAFLSMADFQPNIAGDSMEYLRNLPEDFCSGVGTVFTDGEPRWKKVVQKVKPMSVRFEYGRYHIHFFSYGGDIKEWDFIARPDGTIVDFNLTYPYGVFHDDRKYTIEKMPYGPDNSHDCLPEEFRPFNPW